VVILPQYHEKIKKMVTYFNKKDMISFGKYLVSEERKQRIQNSFDKDKKNGIENSLSVEERLQEVYHADFHNWKDSL